MKAIYFFFHASRGRIGATQLYALPSAWQCGIGTQPPFSKSWIRHWFVYIKCGDSQQREIESTGREIQSTWNFWDSNPEFYI